MVLTPAEQEAIHAQAVEEYPFESCGVILARGSERRLLRCRNAQNELHARDPVRYTRDARTAYYIDPKDLLRIGELERQGFDVAVIYHSHVDAGAYFSETRNMRDILLGAVIGSAKGGFAKDGKGKGLVWPQKGRVPRAVFGNETALKDISASLY